MLLCNGCFTMASFTSYWLHPEVDNTWGLQGKCHKLFSVLFCVYLQIICVKNLSAKGTCSEKRDNLSLCMIPPFSPRWGVCMAPCVTKAHRDKYAFQVTCKVGLWLQGCFIKDH